MSLVGKQLEAKEVSAKEEAADNDSPLTDKVYGRLLAFRAESRAAVWVKWTWPRQGLETAL